MKDFAKRFASQLDKEFRKGFTCALALVLLGYYNKVDAVEVVRCKDCVYFWDGVCTAHTDAICTDENEFCSWGERR